MRKKPFISVGHSVLDDLVSAEIEFRRNVTWAALYDRMGTCWIVYAPHPFARTMRTDYRRDERS